MRRMVGINMNTSNTQTATDPIISTFTIFWFSLSPKSYLCQSHCCTLSKLSTDLVTMITKVEHQSQEYAMFASMVSHLLLKWQNICEMASIAKQLVWSYCCCEVLYIHKWSKWEDKMKCSSASTWTVWMLLFTHMELLVYWYLINSPHIHAHAQYCSWQCHG